LIPVSELKDQHLLAEHREIKRIPNTISSWKYKLENIPDKFCLWTGHVKFFYNKLSWLYARYTELYEECLKRWFNVQNYKDTFTNENISANLFNWYIPNKEDINISNKRIQEKIQQKPLFYRYYWILWTD